MPSFPRIPLDEVITYAPDPYEVNPEGKYPIAGVYGFGRGMIQRAAVAGGELAATQLFRVRAGQFIYSRLKSFEGAYSIVSPEVDGYFVSNEFPTFDLDREQIEPEFLGWYFKQQRVWQQLASDGRGIGARRERLHPKRLLDHAIPLPPLNEQRRIVDRLNAGAAASARGKKAISEIDEDLMMAARNVIWQAGSNPDAWTPCGIFLRQRPLDVRVDAQTVYLFAGVYSFGRGVFSSESKTGSSFAYPALTRLRTNDFVYPKLMAWEGALGVVPPECDGRVVSPEFPVFEIDSGIVHPAVVDTFFRDPRVLPMLRSASSGTNMRRKRIQPSRFLDLKMPIPSTPEQEVVLQILDHRRRALERHETSLRSLDSLLPAMLHEVFGE